MTKLEITNGRLSQSSVESLRANSDMLACQCPAKLLEILDLIRSFETYSESCIVDYPSDAKTHTWLKNQALNLDQLLCNTVIQLARMEGFVSTDNELIARSKGDGDG
ncbi:MAG: hypothetical protein EOP09_02960 [Proteobacteria bacterium]|nr:MAG: hypothetical protein EOP09_02960 [Pseudomonadota bacterium]